MNRALCALSLLPLSLSCAACLAQPHARTSYEAHSEVMRPPSYVIFQDTTGPLSYHSPVGQDVSHVVRRARVQGKVCQTGLQLPLFTGGGVLILSVAWGEGAYRAALDQVHAKLPAGAALFDVRADLQTRSILLLYREQCLVLDAAVQPPEQTLAPRKTTAAR